MSQNGGSSKRNENEEDSSLDVTAIDKNFWYGKTTVKVQDLEKAHGDLIALEDGVNRSLRHLNRNVSTQAKAMNDMSDRINENFTTLSKQIESFDEQLDDLRKQMLEKLERNEEAWRNGRFNYQPMDFNQPMTTQMNPFGQPQKQSTPIQNRNQQPLFPQHNNAAVDFEEGSLFSLNMLTSNGGVEIFNGESVYAFDKWTRRFKDYLEAGGRNWNDSEKVARLKMALGETARDLFDKLTNAERNTVDNALKALRAKLDSPQRREMARFNLSLCKQQENESVDTFLKRLAPLVEVTNPGLDEEAKEQKICEELRGRLKPSLTNMMRLLGTSKIVRLDDFKERAEEVEAVLRSERGTQSTLDQAINMLKSQAIPESGIGNRTGQNGNQNPGPSFRRFTPAEGQRSNNRGRSWNGPNRNRNWNNQQRQSERNWSGRPVCYNCDKVGHIARDCRARKAQFNSRWNNNNNNRPTQPRRNNSANFTPLGNQVNSVEERKWIPVEEAVAMMQNMHMGSNEEMPREELRSVSLNSSIGENAKRAQPIMEKAEPAERQNISKINKTSNWEGIGPGLTKVVLGSLTLLTLLTMVLGQTTVRPEHPLICQKQKEGVLWEFPQYSACSALHVNHSKLPIHKAYTVYLPNSIQHEVEAWACRKIKKVIRKYTSLSGVPVRDPLEPEALEMSAEECRQMIDQQKCSEGVMKNESGLIHTDNKIDLSPRFWLVGSFNWKPAISKNCYLFKTTILTRFGEKSIETPLGTTDCTIEEGKCTMADKTVLIWNAKLAPQCEFKRLGVWKGFQVDNTWISSELSFRLTFPPKVDKVYSCNIGLSRSYEGPAVTEADDGTTLGSPIHPDSDERRKPAYIEFKKKVNSMRGKREVEGWISESVADAKLSYLDNRLTELMTTSFTQSLKMICDYMEETRRWAMSSIMTSPTGFARAVFNEGRLVAKRVSQNLLQVWPCAELKSDDYVFVGTGTKEGNKNCFDQIPIKFRTNGGDFTAFLDPVTMIINPTARKAPCAEYQKQWVKIGNRTLEIDQVTGQVTEAKVKRMNRMDWTAIKAPKISPHIFHHLVLNNVTDFATNAFIASVAKVSAITYRIQNSDTVVLKSMSEEWEDLKDEVEDAIFGKLFKAWAIIQTLMTIIVFLELCFRVYLIFREAYKGGEQNRLSRWAENRGRTETQSSTDANEQISIDSTNMTVRYKPIIKIEKGNGRKATNKQNNENEEEKHVFEVRVLRRKPEELQYCPIVFWKINDNQAKSILDTGAEITVAPWRLARTWNATIKSADGAVEGIGGQEIGIVGKIDGTLTLLGHRIDTTIFIIQDVPETFQWYDIIVGVDTMKKIGRILFDFTNAEIEIGTGTSTSSSDSSERVAFECDTRTEYGKWLYEYVGDATRRKDNSEYKYPIDIVELNCFVGLITLYKGRIQNFDARSAPLRRAMNLNLIQRNRANRHFRPLQDEGRQAYDDLIQCLQNIVAGPRPMPAVGHSINMLSRRMGLQSQWLKERSETAPIIQVNANSTPIKALADTGASLSVAPSSIADVLRCRRQESIAEATSASGHIIIFKECIQFELVMAGTRLPITVHLADDDQCVSMRDYSLILGCDVFKRLGFIGFDFDNSEVWVGGHTIPMERRGLLRGLRVTSKENVTIPGNTQMLIDAQIEAGPDSIHELLIDRPDEFLIKNELGLIATVCPNGKDEIKMAIVNPTMEPKLIREGMHLAYANELLPTEDGWLTEREPKSMLNLDSSERTKQDPTFKVDLDKAEVNERQRRMLEELIEEFSDVFSKNQYDLGMYTAGEYHMDTTTDEPVSSLPRKMPYKFRDELKRHTDLLLQSGVMIESNTPWVSPFVCVQKKDGGMRPCLDLRKLNEVTIPDRYPLPRLDAIMERVGSCKFYTSLDLASGYLQIKLDQETSWKCGVITEDKVYQMITMPFGLKNATAAFSRAMSNVLCGLDDFAISYVDDILIFTKDGTFEDHLQSIKAVLERFRLYNLKLSPKKCIFATKEMNFLGYTLNSEGYKPSLSRIEIIKDMPVPKTVKEVKRVLGKAGFYRKHIEGFSTIVEPLLALTRQTKNFEWGEKQQQAFEKIKQLLAEAPNLVFPDYEKPFHIFTDASTVGQGGILMQKNEATNTFSAISYCSRTLSASERKWPAVQIEMSAIIYALREFRPFIFMSDIELHTDHKPLAFLLKKADTNPQLARWLIELQNYQIKIVHVAGKQNSLADALSRAAEGLPIEEVNDLSELEDIAEFPVCLSIGQQSRLVIQPFINSLTLRHEDGNSYDVDLMEEQRKDPVAEVYIKFLEEGIFPADFSESEKESLAAEASELELRSKILCYRLSGMNPRIYIPISLRSLIFESFHTSPLGGGHLNVRKTLAKCRKYYWPKMHTDIMNWTKLCITCQLRHSPVPAYRAEMMTVPSDTLFARVGLDLAGPFPITKRGNKHIMNAVCWFTKYVVSVPLPDARATTIARALMNNCYLKYGGFNELITDNATAFTSEFFREFCSMLYINKKYALPHWSQGNAATERTFRTFHNILAKYIIKDQPDFDEYLDMVSFCYNTAVHSSTGESPFFLMFGRDPVFCVDKILRAPSQVATTLTDRDEFKQKLVHTLRRAWECAAETHAEAQNRFKIQYDKKVRQPDVQVGDRVLFRNYGGKPNTSKKFHLPWKGIYRVVELDGVHAKIISCTSPNSKPKSVHINQLKKCFEMSGPTCTMPEGRIPDEAMDKEENEAPEESENQIQDEIDEEKTAEQAERPQISNTTENTNKIVDEAESEKMKKKRRTLIKKNVSFAEPLTDEPTSSNEPVRERDCTKYGLRPKPIKKNMLYLISFLTMIGLTLADESRSKISTKDEQFAYTSLILNFACGLLGGLLFSIAFFKWRTQPINNAQDPIWNQNAVECTYCKAGNHAFRDCIKRKQDIKISIRDWRYMQGHDEIIRKNITNSYGLIIDGLGREKGKQFYSIRKAINTGKIDKFVRRIDENEFQIKDILSQTWRPAYLIKRTTNNDLLFDVLSNRETKPSLPYYLLITRSQ